MAVDSVSLEVAPGEIVGLIGPNGAGKTTFIDAVTGFVAPQAGAIFLGDEDVSRVRPYKRARAGIVRTFQSLELFEDFSAWDNFQVAIEPRDRKAYVTGLVRPGRATLSETAAGVIDSFDLSPYLEQFPRDLPYGQGGCWALRALSPVAPTRFSWTSLRRASTTARQHDSHRCSECSRGTLTWGSCSWSTT